MQCCLAVLCSFAFNLFVHLANRLSMAGFGWLVEISLLSNVMSDRSSLSASFCGEWKHISAVSVIFFRKKGRCSFQIIPYKRELLPREMVGPKNVFTFQMLPCYSSNLLSYLTILTIIDIICENAIYIMFLCWMTDKIYSFVHKLFMWNYSIQI